MEILFDNINKLNIAIQDDPRVQRLNEIEKVMENSTDVILLARKKEVIENEYSDLLKHFNDDSKEVCQKRKELYNAKKDLEEHPLVKKYLNAYKEVRLMYQNINEIIFKDFSFKGCKDL